MRHCVTKSGPKAPWASTFRRSAALRRAGCNLTSPSTARSFVREPQELLRLDFQTSLDTPQAHDIAFTVTQDDVCVGIGQWLRLDLSPDNVYENDPALIESSWHHVLHCLKRPIAVKRGDVVRARLTHDDFAINIEFVAQPDDPNARS